jgi:general secretion pathway protein L
VDNLQVIAGPTEGENETPIMAIAKTTLQEQLARFRAAGLHVIAVIPDLVLLPRNDCEWQLCAWDHDALALRTGLLSGAVLETSTLELMLDAAILERQEQTALTISAAISDAGLRSRVQAWAAQYPLIELHFVQAQAAETVLAAHTDWIKHPANLLQGSFALAKRFSLPSGLRMAAMFIAVAFSLQLLSEWVYYGYYQHQAKKAEVAATTLYRQMFPQERRIVNLRRQLQAHMNATAGSGSALPVLTQIAESLQGSGLNAQRVDFANGVLTLDVDARALGELDGFKQKLESQGFQAQIVSANAQGTVIRGRLRVENGA